MRPLHDLCYRQSVFITDKELIDKTLGLYQWYVQTLMSYSSVSVSGYTDPCMHVTDSTNLVGSIIIAHAWTHSEFAYIAWSMQTLGGLGDVSSSACVNLNLAWGSVKNYVHQLSTFPNSPLCLHQAMQIIKYDKHFIFLKNIYYRLIWYHDNIIDL